MIWACFFQEREAKKQGKKNIKQRRKNKERNITRKEERRKRRTESLKGEWKRYRETKGDTEQWANMSF